MRFFDTVTPEAIDYLRSCDIPIVRASDYLSADDPTDPSAIQELSEWDEYFKQFAKLTDAECLCCGTVLSCRFGLGMFGGFQWGLAHGEGHCATCKYPMRGHHIVKGLGSIRNLFLPYHPSLLIQR